MAKPPDFRCDFSTVANDSVGTYLIPANRSWGNPAWELPDDLHVELRYSESEVPAVACLAVQEYEIGETL